MKMTQIIQKKREGSALSPEEIRFFVEGLQNGETPDYQAAALLMAIYFRGMNQAETLELTSAMLQSGDSIDLSALPGIKVDKHSTGGVGDKTTLVLAPLVAATGVPIAKMSGRGLGHTGGTIDKLEVFPGLTLELPTSQFIQQVQDIGLAVVAQTQSLVPADKKLYALRDVTATVGSIPLIASSIMSKKLASGCEAIVLDVKAGKGSFMTDEASAFNLANVLVEIGEGMGRRTVAVVTAMDEPLGHAVGNAIEVAEAIQTLKGEGPADLLELCLELGANMLLLAKRVDDEASARSLLMDMITSGKALAKFKEMITRQGGDASSVDDPSLFPTAKYTHHLKSHDEGYLSSLNAKAVGVAAMALGAGRETKGSPIDLAAGIYLHKKRGDKVAKGDVLATLHAASPQQIAEGTLQLAEAFAFSAQPPAPAKLILGKEMIE